MCADTRRFLRLFVGPVGAILALTVALGSAGLPVVAAVVGFLSVPVAAVGMGVSLSRASR